MGQIKRSASSPSLTEAGVKTERDGFTYEWHRCLDCPREIRWQELRCYDCHKEHIRVALAASRAGRAAAIERWGVCPTGR